MLATELVAPFPTVVDVASFDHPFVSADLAYDPAKSTESFLPPHNVFGDRRMSTVSAASDDSSKDDKRLLTPEDSPEPGHRSRPTLRVDGSYSGSEEGRDSANGQRAVQLPSMQASFDDYPRRMSLPTDSLGRVKVQPGQPRSAYPSSPYNNYSFPPDASGDRPRLDVGAPSLSPYPEHSPYPSSAVSAGGSSYYGSPTMPDAALNGQGQSFAGAMRISGHGDRRGSLATSSLGPDVKTETQWTFPSNEYNGSPGGASLTPASDSSVPPSSTRSPQSANSAVPDLVPGTAIERAPRKRGKLPKHVTDYLKEWLHHHSDHPYPSEEEKKALCNHTGLSMSQVSNWMINARRRILAPAQRAAAAAQAASMNSPYGNRAASQTHALIAGGRRASVPGSADGMALYHPNYHAGGAPYPYGGTDSMGRPVAPRSASYSMDPAYASQRLAYSQQPGGYLPSGVPMSAPPGMAPNPFAGGPQYGGYPGGGYPREAPSGKQSYYTPSGSTTPGGAGSTTPGSNYGTPQ